MEIKSHVWDNAILFSAFYSFFHIYLSVLLRPNFLKKLKYTWFSHALSRIHFLLRTGSCSSERYSYFSFFWQQGPRLMMIKPRSHPSEHPTPLVASHRDCGEKGFHFSSRNCSTLSAMPLNHNIPIDPLCHPVNRGVLSNRLQENV